jgi:hypothetical protein
MVMDVCVNGPQANAPIVAASPLNPQACPYQLNIQPGEVPPYYAAAWGVSGVSRRYMFPSGVVGTDQNQNSYPLVIGWTDHSGKGVFGASDNVSVMSIQNGYASDMGSTGGDTLSLNFGAAYSMSAQPKPEGIARFANSWIFFNTNLAAPNLSSLTMAETSHFTTSAEQLGNLSREQFLADGIPAPNPASLKPFFSLELRKIFTFSPTSSVYLDTIVEDKYSGTDEEGLSPGLAAAKERVYFTKQLGETRWEDWKNYDSGVVSSNFTNGASLRNMCGKPAQMLPDGSTNVAVSRHFVLGNIVPYDSADGLVHSWMQNVQSYDDATNSMVTHAWYLVTCADWTNITVLSTPLPYSPQSVVSQAPLLTNLLNLYVAP